MVHMLIVEMLPRFVVIVEPVKDDTVMKELTRSVEAVTEEVLKVDATMEDTVKEDNKSVLARMVLPVMVHILIVEMLPRFVVIVEPVKDDTVMKELTTRVDAVIEEVPKDDMSAVDTVRDDNRSVLA
jgi:hypothetical protein